MGNLPVLREEEGEDVSLARPDVDPGRVCAPTTCEEVERWCGDDMGGPMMRDETRVTCEVDVDTWAVRRWSTTHVEMRQDEADECLCVSCALAAQWRHGRRPTLHVELWKGATRLCELVTARERDSLRSFTSRLACHRRSALYGGETRYAWRRCVGPLLDVAGMDWRGFVVCNRLVERAADHVPCACTNPFGFRCFRHVLYAAEERYVAYCSHCEEVDGECHEPGCPAWSTGNLECRGAPPVEAG